MNKAACEVRSSARGSNLLPSPNQSQASSAVISCSTSVEHTPSNVNSCSTSVQHNPSNVNSTGTTTPDSGLKSEPKLEHQKQKPGSKKKVKFSQEEVEEEGTHESLQPPSNVTSSNAQVISQHPSVNENFRTISERDLSPYRKRKEQRGHLQGAGVPLRNSSKQLRDLLLLRVQSQSARWTHLLTSETRIRHRLQVRVLLAPWRRLLRLLQEHSHPHLQLHYHHPKRLLHLKQRHLVEASMQTR